ncbi:MAG: hypothetical protein AABY22_20320 [Nanoarchaeota archaeon]
MEGKFNLKQTISGLQKRRLSKIIEEAANAEAEKQERLALEKLASKYKNKGIKELAGNNFTLKIV